MKHLTLVLSMALLGCGSDEQKQDAAAGVSISDIAAGIPDFSTWQAVPGAEDVCLKSDKTCTTKFMAGDSNCSDATFKFILKFEGEMIIYTVENVFIRQGEPHEIKFQGDHETHKIQDQTAVEAYHVFRCYGPNGQVVRI